MLLAFPYLLGVSNSLLQSLNWLFRGPVLNASGDILFIIGIFIIAPQCPIYLDCIYTPQSPETLRDANMLPFIIS